ncbi:hypothetical protein ACTQ5R_09255 [Ruoffia tabacinasalis]|uniref:hypothetical protein n=1 Tax=Ruoffia tabacinasalis TaxID=87458 RepID=UPI003F9A905A
MLAINGLSSPVIRFGKHVCFDFGRLGKEGIGFDKGKYKVGITLAIPSVHKEEFVIKAGLEYENLKGKYVDRTGIGPTISYTEEFGV